MKSWLQQQQQGQGGKDKEDHELPSELLQIHEGMAAAVLHKGPRFNKSNKSRRLASAIACVLAMIYVICFMAILQNHNEALHNLHSHHGLGYVAHTHLPPPQHGGQGTNTTASTRKPRVVAITSLQYDIPSKWASNSGPFPVEPSWYTPNAQNLLRENDRCEVMYQWQLEFFPNCNNFHELDMTHMKMLNSGKSRTAYEMKQHLEGGMLSRFVYKALKFEYDFDEIMIEGQRKDALVLERATSSQFLPNIYGYCNAVLMDFAPEGDMNDYVTGARVAKKKGGNKSLSPVDKLRVAIHIASGVRDFHEIGDVKEIPAFYHNDLFLSQYLFHDGIFKLNDFNLAQPMTFAKKNTTKNEICLHDMACMWFSRTCVKIVKYRTLEDHLWSADDARVEPFSGDKADIYMMGNVMYTILTDLHLFEEPKYLTPYETTKALIAGKRSPYPEDIEKSTHPAHIAVKKAIEMCWIEKWNKRPSARLIVDFLMGQLRDITNEEHPDLHVTLPARDPDQ